MKNLSFVKMPSDLKPFANQQHSEGAEQRSGDSVIGMSQCYIDPKTCPLEFLRTTLPLPECSQLPSFIYVESLWELWSGPVAELAVAI